MNTNPLPVTDALPDEDLHIFFDVETSGFASKKLPANHPDQAWAVQLAAILSTKSKIIGELNVIIKANGRPMNSHAQAVHGISPETADRDGIPELDAIAQFAALLVSNPKKVCHNYDFDSQFIAHMFERNMDELTDEQRSRYFIDLPHFCTMKDTGIKKYVSAKNVNGRAKFPKLSELYHKLFNRNFDDAHDAMADVRALRDSFYELQTRGVI